MSLYNDEAVKIIWKGLTIWSEILLAFETMFKPNTLLKNNFLGNLAILLKKMQMTKTNQHCDCRKLGIMYLSGISRLCINGSKYFRAWQARWFLVTAIKLSHSPPKMLLQTILNKWTDESTNEQVLFQWNLTYNRITEPVCLHRPPRINGIHSIVHKQVRVFVLLKIILIYLNTCRLGNKWKEDNHLQVLWNILMLQNWE